MPFIHLGDPVSVEVPSLNRTFPGRIKRFSEDVAQATRTMHTEVEVLNPDRTLEAGTARQRRHRLQQKKSGTIVDTATGFGPASRPRLGGRARSIQSDRSPATPAASKRPTIQILSGVKQGRLR